MRVSRQSPSGVGVVVPARNIVGLVMDFGRSGAWIICAFMVFLVFAICGRV